MATPTRLYKYMPSRFTKGFLERGDLLFRNLAYFRQIEEKGRCDLLEGLHMDYPDNEVTIETTDGRVRWRGRAAFLNSVNSNELFAFCLSEVLSTKLFTEFGADSCVEILDPTKFLQRCRETVARHPGLAESGLLHGRVEYYAPNKGVMMNVKDPRCIPFFKHEEYSHQCEYRLAAARPRGLHLTQTIVSPTFSFDDEIAAGRPEYEHLFIGSLKDIAKVHNA